MSSRGAGRAAAAAALLAATSWLAVGVGADPSGAANTAAEYLVDGDDDGVAGSRPFAGRDRYDTALLLARRYAAVRGGLGSVRTAIVVSGESPPDAAAVAGLAGIENAPVLLVRPGGLHRAAAEFLEDHDVKQIFVVGGPAAVPDDLVPQLAGLVSQPQVTRLAGEDRYATAAAVASHIGGRATWCTSNDSTAVLINGDARSAIDAAAIGPLTYALGLPTVLTRTSRLPEATARFLREHDIDHAVVVGGADAVAESVITQLGHAGVPHTTRLEGSGAAQTAARIADLMHGDCAFASGRRASLVALVGREAAMDGLAAAPLLGEGLGSGRALPVLVAGDSLPADTATWLAATPVEADRLKTHLRIVAIGGSGAVSSEAMAAAVKAATTGGPFTATIAARAGERSFTITTSDALNVELPDAQGKAHDLLYINDVPVHLAPVGGLDVLPGEPCLEPRRFKINLRHPLEAGDVIELRPTEVRFGARDDRRPFSPARLVVPEPAVDTAAPKVRIVAPAGSESLLAVISDDSELDEIIVNPRQVRVITRRGTAVVAAEDTPEVLPLHEAAVFALRLTAPTGYTRPAAGGSGSELVAPGGAYRLEPGDRMLLRHGVAVDAAGNRSRAGSVNVTAPQHSLRAVSISVAAAKTRDEASTDAVSGDADDDLSGAQALLAGTLRITARDSGDAAGALGITWEVRTSRLSTHDPAVEQIGIDIAVSSRDKIISIRFASGTPNFGQLADALNADAGFARHFEADTPEGICAGRAQTVDLAHPDMDGATRLAGGVTVAEVTVRFNNLVRRYRSESQNLPCPQSGTGVGQEAVADAEAGAREFVEHVLAGIVTDFTTLAAAEGAGDILLFEAPVPYDQMKFRYTTLDPSRGSLLGVSRYDVVEIPAGAMCGYGADDPATGEDESLSVSSRLRPQRR
ncbi:cell wall-binding repeat-containing protein [Candidatus Poriferisodalis sp.]|uniref:cell wall-binding repeat-containing protein n=1 Tax=Candidatus Poriferisodalis sp. TaxID=3101277 RepID=UPI003B02798D